MYTDNEIYVKYDSNADPKNEPIPQQNSDVHEKPEDEFLGEMAERRAKREAQERSRTQSKGPRKR